jgi:hypothetical protein
MSVGFRNSIPYLQQNENSSGHRKHKWCNLKQNKHIPSEYLPLKLAQDFQGVSVKPEIADIN